MGEPIVLRAGRARVELDSAGWIRLVADGVARVAFTLDRWWLELVDHVARSEEATVDSVRTSGATATFELLTRTGDRVRVEYVLDAARNEPFLTRTLTLLSGAKVRLGRVGSAQTFTESPEHWFELRTFSEAPFASASRFDGRTLLSGFQNPHSRPEFDGELKSEFPALLDVVGEFRVTPEFFAVVTPRVGVGEQRHRGSPAWPPATWGQSSSRLDDEADLGSRDVPRGPGRLVGRTAQWQRAVPALSY